MLLISSIGFACEIFGMGLTACSISDCRRVNAKGIERDL